MSDYTMFPEAPIIQAIDSETWILRRDYVNRYTGRVIRQGFEFDGASIPRSLWRVAGHPMSGDVLPAALEHDAEYGAQLIQRAEADKRFLFNMKIRGVGLWRRTAFYLAVRLFGGCAWRENLPDVDMVRLFVMEVEKWRKQREKNSKKKGKNCVQK